MEIAVVADAAVLATSLSLAGAGSTGFPPVPPQTGQPSRDVLGVFAYPGDAYFGLVFSDPVVEQLTIALADRSGLGWDLDEATAAMGRLDTLAFRCGGGVVDPGPAAEIPRQAGVTAAAAIQAAASAQLGNLERIVVTNDARVLRTRRVRLLSGQEVILQTPAQFIALVEKVRWRMRHVNG
jgi:hypothetical protein